MLRSAVVAAALTLTACSGCAVTPSSTTVACTIDDAFTTEEKAAINASLQDWSDATGGRFWCAYDVAQPNVGRISFHKRQTPEGQYGHTDWEQRWRIEADVVILPELPIDMVAIVAKHETGHALGLSYDGADPDHHHYHGSEPSLMHPFEKDNSHHIEAVDLAAFDARWK
jgi:hypothetical protein